MLPTGGGAIIDIGTVFGAIDDAFPRVARAIATKIALEAVCLQYGKYLRDHFLQTKHHLLKLIKAWRRIGASLRVRRQRSNRDNSDTDHQRT